MKDDIQKPKQRGFHPKHRQLLFDTVLVFLPFINPHFSIPVAIVCVVRIALDFHKWRKER